MMKPEYTLIMPMDGKTPPESPLYGRQLSFERDYVEVTTWGDGFWRKDPDWTYTDHRGHEHYRDGDSFPTLRSYSEECPGCWSCSDTEGHYTWTTYECIGCGEVIDHPGLRWDSGSVMIDTGRPDVYLDGEWISWTEFGALIDQHNQIVREKGLE